MANTGYVVGAGEDLEGEPDLKASAASTGGALTLYESRTTGGAPLHVHEREDECFYVVEGTITVRCGDEEWEASPRSFVFLPRGIPHAWDVSSGTATVLMITVPAGLDEFLQEYHAAGSASQDVKDQIAAKYGIEWVRGPEAGAGRGAER
jgi:mannose-6-phosphate isomerase-like protein (cupin superfamily)